MDHPETTAETGRGPTRRYDGIGHAYTSLGRPDPRIATQIWAAVGEARRVVNGGRRSGQRRLAGTPRRPDGEGGHRRRTPPGDRRTGPLLSPGRRRSVVPVGGSGRRLPLVAPFPWTYGAERNAK